MKTIILIESNNIEDLEGVCRIPCGESVLASEQIDLPSSITHILDDQRGVENELEDHHNRSIIYVNNMNDTRQ